MQRWQEDGVGECKRKSKGRESDLSSMLLQPSFQIRTAPSPENVTFSQSRRGRDGGSEKGGGGVGGGGRQMGKGGREATAGSQKREDGRIEGESERKEAAAEDGEREEGGVQGFTW